MKCVCIDHTWYSKCIDFTWQEAPLYKSHILTCFHSQHLTAAKPGAVNTYSLNPVQKFVSQFYPYTYVSSRTPIMSLYTDPAAYSVSYWHTTISSWPRALEALTGCSQVCVGTFGKFLKTNEYQILNASRNKQSQVQRGLETQLAIEGFFHLTLLVTSHV